MGKIEVEARSYAMKRAKELGDVKRAKEGFREGELFGLIVEEGGN